MKQLVVSYSMMSSFLKCEMIGYWRYVKGYERIILNVNFIEGDAYHYGVGLLYRKEEIDQVLRLTSKHYLERVQEERNKGAVNSKDEQKLVEGKIITLGMVKGYSEFSKRDIKSMKLIENETDASYPVEKTNALVRIRQDNILEYKKDWLGHEIKTSKTVNEKYVENSQYSFQVALYFHVYNSQFDLPKNQRPKGKKLSALLYDAVQKPSIRRKKKENEKQFLKRLGQYYTASDASTKFYKDTFQPKISREHVYDTLKSCISKIQRIQEGRKPIKSFSDCAWCDYLSLCHGGGETKQNMVGYRNRYENKRGGKNGTTN